VRQDVGWAQFIGGGNKEVTMTVDEVVELIKKHRSQHLRPPVGQDAGDPLRWSDGGFHRAVIQEYDALLEEIQNGSVRRKHVAAPPM
jgi:hypothetical protein